MRARLLTAALGTTALIVSSAHGATALAPTTALQHLPQTPAQSPVNASTKAINTAANQPGNTEHVFFAPCNGQTQLDPQLAFALRSVPIPASASETTANESMAVYDDATDRLWEFSGMTKTDHGWSACSATLTPAASQRATGKVAAITAENQQSADSDQAVAAATNVTEGDVGQGRASSAGPFKLGKEKPKPEEPKKPATPPQKKPARGGLVQFSPNSFIYQSVRNAPVAKDSPALVSRLAKTVTEKWEGDAASNIYEYNSSFYVADAKTPRQNLKFDDCQGKGWLDPQFAAALKNVPIPSHAVPATGSDSNLTIFDPANDTLWEFWVAKKKGNQWSACWGGKLSKVSKNPGYFPATLGATATGISQTATMISVEEAQKGQINHAMCLVAVDIKKWTEFSWPAQRSDGHLDAHDAIPQGRRLRLDPSVDVDSLKLTPFAKAVAKAAQEYGFVVCDKGGAVAVIGESGTPHKKATGKNPWDGVRRGVPDHQLLAGFPWHKMQVLPHNYGKPGAK